MLVLRLVVHKITTWHRSRGLRVS